MTVRGLVLVGLALVFGGCSSVDYGPLADYYANEPHSVVVLPVMNETTDAEAAHLFQSTIVKPLVDRGYYVFPIELVAEILDREGISDAGAAWQVAPERLARYLGADSVLYVTIRGWDTAYQVISSSVQVALDYRLVDTRSGDVLWQRQQAEVFSSPRAGVGNPIADLVVSAVSAAVTAATTDYVPLAFKANENALTHLPVGRYHADHAKVLQDIDTWKANRAKERAAANE